LDITPGLAATIAVTFFAAGTLKGLIGLGFPTVVMGVLTTIVGIKPAMALLLIPAIATNAFQVLDSGRALPLFRRFWPMLVGVLPGVWLGTGFLAASSGNGPALLLGLLIFLHASVGLARIELPAPGARERWLTPLLGIVNGSITGVTGSSVIPGVLYFQALRLDKDGLVGAMGLVFGISTTLLALFLARYGLLTTQLAALSVTCLIPSFVGMRVGARLRHRLSEERFTQALLGGLCLLGLYVVARAIL